MASTAARSSRTSSRSSRTEVSVDAFLGEFWGGESWGAPCAQAGESREMTSSPKAGEFFLLMLDPHFLMVSVLATGERVAAATPYDARRLGAQAPADVVFSRGAQGRPSRRLS